MLPWLESEVRLGGARLREGDGALEHGVLLACEREDAPVVVGVWWRPRYGPEMARTACVMRETFAASFPSLIFGTASKSGACTAIQRARARSRCTAALMSARCVKACGKLPRASPEDPSSSA